MPIPHFYSSLNVAELRKVANVTERLAQANTFDPILDFKLDGAARLTRQAARTAHRVADLQRRPTVATGAYLRPHAPDDSSFRNSTASRYPSMHP